MLAMGAHRQAMQLQHLDRTLRHLAQQMHRNWSMLRRFRVLLSVRGCVAILPQNTN